MTHNCEDCKFYQPAHHNINFGWFVAECRYRVVNKFNNLNSFIGSLEDNKDGICRNFYQKVVIPPIKKSFWKAFLGE